MDFLFPDGYGVLRMVECKAAKTVKPEMAAPLASLSRSFGGFSGNRAPVSMSIVHRASSTALPAATRAILPGTEAVDVETFVKDLNRASGLARKKLVKPGRASKRSYNRTIHPKGTLK